MDIQRLHPLAQCELARRKPAFLDTLFARLHRPTHGSSRTGAHHADRRGRYPAALERKTQRRRAAWYRNYIDALVQRDVRELARIASLDALPRLLSLAAAQTAVC